MTLRIPKKTDAVETARSAIHRQATATTPPTEPAKSDHRDAVQQQHVVRDAPQRDRPGAMAQAEDRADRTFADVGHVDCGTQQKVAVVLEQRIEPQQQRSR